MSSVPEMEHYIKNSAVQKVTGTRSYSVFLYLNHEFGSSYSHRWFDQRLSTGNFFGKKLRAVDSLDMKVGQNEIYGLWGPMDRVKARQLRSYLGY